MIKIVIDAKFSASDFSNAYEVWLSYGILCMSGAFDGTQHHDNSSLIVWG